MGSAELLNALCPGRRISVSVYDIGNEAAGDGLVARWKEKSYLCNLCAALGLDDTELECRDDDFTDCSVPTPQPSGPHRLAAFIVSNLHVATQGQYLLYVCVWFKKLILILKRCMDIRVLPKGHSLCYR